MTESSRPESLEMSASAGCTDDCCPTRAPLPLVRDAVWHRAAGQARLLAWVSLVWMGIEGAIGLWQGLAVGSIALIGWALGSAVEGLASVIVVWRFTGERTLSDIAERRAQQAVAVSFWLLAPYVAIESVRHLASGHRAETTVLGMVLAASSLLVMPILGYAKQRLGLLGGDRWRGHPELSMCSPGRRCAAQPGRDRQLDRRLVARPGHRPSDRRLVGVGRDRSLARR